MPAERTDRPTNGKEWMNWQNWKPIFRQVCEMESQMPNKKLQCPPLCNRSQRRMAGGDACSVSGNFLYEKLKQSFLKRKPRRHMGAWQYNSIHFLLQQWMEVNEERHASAVLSKWKQSSVPTG